MSIGPSEYNSVAQFDVYENSSKRNVKQFPFLLEVQSDVFEDSSRAVDVPLVNSDSLCDSICKGG